MSEGRPPDVPLAPVADFLAVLRKCKAPGMIIGGLAVAFLGRARTTRDVDVVVLLEENRWQRLLDVAAKLSFTPRVDDPLDFARSRRMILLRHTKSGVDLDISLAGTAFEVEALKRSKKLKVGRLSLPLPSAEDLIVFKGVAHRPIDLEDIRGLLALHTDLDRKYILRWMDDFAQALDDPELYSRMERLLNEGR